MEAINQGQSIRRWAEFLFNKFMAGDVLFVPKDNPANLVFDWHQQDKDSVPAFVKQWAMQLARTNAELTHFHAVQMITQKKEPPCSSVKQNCIQYIEMMRNREATKSNNPPQ